MKEKNKNHSKRDFQYIWTKYNLKWVVMISIWTFFLTILFTLASESVLNNTQIFLSFLILFGIIFLGVASDMIGIAITAASERPFHAMASDKVSGAKYAIKLKKNTGVVSNFCNDVVGDICGIISGVAGASIVLQIDFIHRGVLTIVLTSLIASLTVGGKALGKNLAVYKSHEIVFRTAKVLTKLKEGLGVDFIKENK